MKKKWISGIIIVILLITPFLIRLFHRDTSRDLPLGDAGWTFTSIPLPAEVTGPYLPHAVLSEDNRTLAVFGRGPLSPELYDTYFVDSVFSGREAFETARRVTGQKIYVSNWPPKSPKDYRLVAELPGISQVVAAAFSPDGKTLAFISNAALWFTGEHDQKTSFVNLKALPKDDAFNTVLYFLSLEDGTLKPLAAIQPGSDGDMGSLVGYALCWNNTGDTIYCIAPEFRESGGMAASSVLAVNRSGEFSVIKNLPANLTTSNLKYRDHELRFFTYKTPAGIQGSDSVFTRMKTDGTIVQTKKLNVHPFTPISGSGFSPLLIGDSRILIHAKHQALGSFFQRISTETLEGEVSQSIPPTPVPSFAFSYRLCQFLNDEKQFLVVQSLDTGALAEGPPSREKHTNAKKMYEAATKTGILMNELLLVTQK